MMQCKVEMESNLILDAVSGLQFYDGADVYIRELLANAIDACNTRAALEYSWGTEFLEIEEARMMNSMRTPYQPKISIVYNSMTQRLTVEDNGIGMNGQDIERYVSKVGKSYYTSESFEKQQLDYEPVSQFGMGMLSCFTVSRAMLIEAKKDKCVNTAWNIADQQDIEAITAKWLEGTDEIEYITSNRGTSGTKITLVLKPQYAMRLTHHGMMQAVRRYLMYSPFPIEVVYDQKKAVLEDPNPILDNPLADIAGIVSIPIADEELEGFIWLYNGKYERMRVESRLYQQNFLVAEEEACNGLQPEWVQHMSCRLHLKKRFLTLPMNRSSVVKDEKYQQLREKIGQKIVKYFTKSPLTLNLYLSDGKKSVLTEYESEMELLAKAVTVDVFLKGQIVELPIDTIVHGFEGKAIRIAFITQGLFDYYRKNYQMDFRRFLKENKLIVFEKNRDIFCQMMAPYRKSQRYIISDCPGIIYDEMVADFHMLRSVVAYRNAYRLRPPKLGYDEIFCYVTNNQSGILDIIINEDHMLAKMLAPVQYHPKVHRMMAVIKENIKQRILNAQKRWDKIIDFGGCFMDEWNDTKNIASVQAMWCLEDDFVVSLNEYVSSVLDNRERAQLGLIAFEFHRDDFIDWWFVPGAQTK